MVSHNARTPATWTSRVSTVMCPVECKIVHFPMSSGVIFCALLLREDYQSNPSLGDVMMRVSSWCVVQRCSTIFGPAGLIQVAVYIIWPAPASLLGLSITTQRNTETFLLDRRQQGAHGKRENKANRFAQPSARLTAPHQFGPTHFPLPILYVYNMVPTSGPHALSPSAWISVVEYSM